MNWPQVSWNDYRWLSVSSLSGPAALWLKKEFRFKQFDLDICLENHPQRPKWEEYPNYNFLILHCPILDRNRLTIQQLYIFVGHDFLVTIGENDLVKDWFKAAESEKHQAKRWLEHGPGYLLYEIVDRLVDQNRQTINRLTQQVARVDSQLFSLRRKIIDEISLLRRNLIVFHTSLKPMIHIFRQLEMTKTPYLNSQLAGYWGKIGDDLKQAAALLKDQEELLDGLATTFDSLLTHRTNQTMKILTIFSVLLLPLTLVSGVMGMNVTLPLAPNPTAFWWIIGLMAGLTGAMLLLFRRQGWI